MRIKSLTVQTLAALTLAALLQQTAFAAQGGGWVQAGRTNLAAHNLTAANAYFANAVATSPNDPTGNVLYAATRLLVLPSQTPIDSFLTRLGVAIPGRDLYHWTARPATNANGHLKAPPNVSAAEAPALARTNVLLELISAAANLAKVTNPGFLLALSSDETTTTGVTLDYGDILMLRAMVQAAEYLDYTMYSWNSDVQLTAVEQFLTNHTQGVQQLLAQNSQLLTFHTTADLQAAEQAFTNGVTLYLQASDFIRHRPRNVTRLFNYDADMADSELKFRETLVDLEASLTNIVVSEADTNYAFHLLHHFDGSHAPREFLPAFTNNLIVEGTLPDPTFGGVILGLASQQVDDFFAKHFEVKTPDARAWLVIKGQNYNQTSSGAPVLDAAYGYVFLAEVQLGSSDSITNVLLTLPNSSTTPIAPQGSYDPDTGSYVTNTFLTTGGFASQGQLDSAYPNGAYQFTLGCVVDGTRQVTLYLTNDAYPTVVPHISNFDAAQFINGGQDFTVTWDPLTGGAPTNFVQLTVRDQNGNQVFNTPNSWEEGRLNGVAVSATIPAGTLQRGHIYNARLVFAIGTDKDTNSFPAGLGGAAYSTDVNFPIGVSDLYSISLVKSAYFVQTNDLGPVPSSGIRRPDAFHFNASVYGLYYTVTNILLQLPNGTFITNTYPGYLYASASFTNQADLDAAYPDGNYILTVYSSFEGVRTLTLPLNGAPAPPHISNYAAAQNINGYADFTLTWDPFAGSTMNDSVQLSAYEYNYGQTIIGDSSGIPLTLSNNATSFTIPAYTLDNQDSAGVDIIFTKSSAVTGSYPGAPITVGYSEDTSVTVFAANGPSPDLMPEDFNVPNTAAPGQTVAISYDAENSGDASLPVAYWQDAIYLSTNSSWNVHATNLATFYEGRGLDAGKSYTELGSITLPAWPAGSYYLILSVNNDQGVPELNFDNNTLAVPITLVARAPDTNPPTVSIGSGPLSGALLTNATVTLTGQGSDNVGVAVVEWQLRNASGTNGWQPATGTTNWSATIPNLAPGGNTVAVRARDTSGNLSSEVTRTWDLLVSFTVTVSGCGTLTPAYSGTTFLEAGSRIALEATACEGDYFSGWAGSITAGASALGFAVRSNMVLHATFLAGTFVPANATYNGLFYDETNGVALPSAGAFTIATTTKNKLTGTLFIGGARYPLSSSFNSNGVAPITITKARLAGSVRVDLGPGSDRLTGTLGNGSWTAALFGFRAGFDGKTTKATQYARKYTLNVPGSDEAGLPGGDGYGALSVDLSGKVKLAGALADGTPLSQTMSLSKEGYWALYESLYGGKGLLWGWLTFTNRPANTNQLDDDLNGLLSWIKSASAAGKTYQAGFTNDQIGAVGLSYSAPSAGSQVLSLANGFVVFSDGGLAPFTNWVRMAKNKLVSTNANKLTFTFVPASGLFNGSVKPIGEPRSIPFKGAVLQRHNLGGGYFLKGTQSGRAWLAPQE